jgi:hypothetical protein
MSTVLDSSLEPPPTGKTVPWFKKIYINLIWIQNI